MPKAQLITHEDAEEVFFDTETQNGAKTKHEQKLEDILAGLNSATENAYIALYRQNGTGRESLTFLKKFPADKFEGMEDILEYLSTQHGGGDYRIHVRINGKLAANNLVSVEEPKKTDELPRGTDPALNAVLAQMEKQNQMIAGLYQQLSEQAKSPQNSGRREWLEEMMLYKQLFSTGQSSGGIGQINEAIGFLKEIGVNIGGVQEEKEEGFSDILKNALPLLTSAMQNQHPQQRPPQTANPNMQQQNAMKLQIKMAVDSAVRAAVRGSDAAAFAEMADTQLGENAVKLVTDPNIFQILIAYNPEVEKHKPWFGDVIEHIRAMNGLPSRFSSEYDDSDSISENVISGGTDNVQSSGNAGG